MIVDGSILPFSSLIHFSLLSQGNSPSPATPRPAPPRPAPTRSRRSSRRRRGRAPPTRQMSDDKGRGREDDAETPPLVPRDDPPPPPSRRFALGYVQVVSNRQGRSASGARLAPGAIRQLAGDWMVAWNLREFSRELYFRNIFKLYANPGNFNFHPRPPARRARMHRSQITTHSHKKISTYTIKAARAQS